MLADVPFVIGNEAGHCAQLRPFASTCDINVAEMLERHMEDLIAAYPEEFFPGQRLALVGRQQTFAGIGRFDLLFKDGFGANVLMELKAVPTKYENATQLAKYKEALEAQ